MYICIYVYTDKSKTAIKLSHSNIFNFSILLNFLADVYILKELNVAFSSLLYHSAQHISGMINIYKM